MNTFFRKRIKGFTVIELMIVLVIVAILVALAYPSYIQYVRKSKRGEAQQLLLNWSINQEIWRSNNTSYNGVIPCDNPPGTSPGAIIPCNNENFQFSIADVGPTSYTLQVTAIGDQAKDKAKNGDYCGGNGQLLTLTESGVKSPPACWD